MFAGSFAQASRRQAKDPVGAVAARARAQNTAGRLAAKTQKPLLPYFPKLNRPYTAKELGVIQTAHIKAAKEARRMGIPLRDVQRYLRQTHTRQRTAAYDKAVNQINRRNTAQGSVAYKNPPKRKGRGKLATILLPSGSTKLVVDATLGAVGRELKESGAGDNSVLGTTAKIGTNSVKDALSLPAAVVPSTYATGDALVSAVRGDPSKAKRLFHEFKEGDPLALTAQGRFKEAAKAAAEHPVGTILEVRGVKAAAGRGAGRIVPRGERAPKTLEGTSLEQRRTYSRDLFTRTREKRKDRRSVQQAARLRREAEQHFERGETDKGTRKLQQANRKTQVTDDEIRRRVDETVSANEEVRRSRRQKTIGRVNAAVLPEKKGGAVVSPVAQRIVKPTRKDLARFRDELDAEAKSLRGDKPRYRANRKLRAQIDKAVRSKKTDLNRVAKAADHYTQTIQPLVDKVVRAGMLEPEQADRAKLIPYAIRHMGARHDPELGIVIDEDPEERNFNAVSEAKRATASERNGNYEDRALVATARLGDRASVVGAAKRLGRLTDEQEARARELDDYATALEARAQHQRETGRFAFGKANEKHLQRAADQARAEALRIRAGKTDAVDAREDGKFARVVSNDEIRAHMRENGVEEPGFVTQAPNQRGGRNFFQSFYPRKGMATQTRTGEATRKGTFDSDPETLKEQAARLQTMADADDSFKNFVNEFGARRRDGDKRSLVSVATYSEARRVANVLEQESGRGWTPVRLNPWGGRKAQLQALLDETTDNDPFNRPEKNPLTEAMDEALSAKDGDGPWGVIPEAAAERMQQHLRVMGSGGPGKAMQVVNQAFRQAVLPLSAKWLTGNVVEAALRTGIVRAGPRSWYTGRQVQKALVRLDPDAAEQLEARATRGGHYSFAERQAVHRSAEQFRTSGPVLRNLARAAGAFWRSPGPKQTATAWRWFTHHVFETVNGTIERQFQTAMAGRYMRDELMPATAIKTGQKAIEQAAKGLRGTDEQVALGRYVDEAYGRYSKFSPTERRLIVLYTPFAAWLVNATKFVAITLPKDHPILTGLLAAQHQATEEWRKKYGLDLFADNRKPGFLQGTLPASNGGSTPAARYTPFGAFSDYPGAIADSILPQINGAKNALEGRDWKGDRLYVDGKEPDDVQRFRLAFQSFLEATVPVAPVVLNTLGREGSAKDKLRGQFDPFRTIPRNEKGRKKKQKGGGGIPNLREQLRGSPSGGGLQGVDNLRDQLKGR